MITAPFAKYVADGKAGIINGQILAADGGFAEFEKLKRKAIGALIRKL